MTVNLPHLLVRFAGLSLLVCPALASQALAAEVPAPVLFRGADVVTMTEAGVLEDRDVLVSDGRIAGIAAAGSLEIPDGAAVVDASGRVLMPGLAEMHAHVPGPGARDYAEDVLLLYVAHGITTIRGMLGDPWHLELRSALARREVLGPRLYTAGPSLNGKSAPDVDTARRLVKEQKAAGYDFLKLHPGLEREVFDAIVDEASTQGIPFSGHVSDDVGLVHALEARQSAIDHLDGYMQFLAEPRCLDGSIAPGFFGVGLTACAQPERIAAAVAATLAAGTWQAPTQVLLEQWAFPPTEEELRARPAVRYVPARVVERWQQTRQRFIGLQALHEEQARRFIDLRRQLIRELHAAGVPILLASDAPQVFTVPGDSALAELQIYVASGLSTRDALATGTVNPARFYEAEDAFGSIREGLEADLVLLGGNPLEDIANVRRIEGVMVRGRWLDRAALDDLLEDLAERARQ
jgi:imidazolonepropionase-like amidohydrolase